MALLSGLTVNAPGTYVFPKTSGVRPANIIPFNNCYMVGHSTIGDKNKPTRISSSEDFTNVFGTSDSSKEVDLFFANSGGYGNLYFVNTAIAARSDVVIADGGSGSPNAGDHVLTINGVVITVTAAGTETLTEFATDFKTAIEANSTLTTEVNVTVDTTPGQFEIRSKNPIDALAITESDVNLTVTDTTPTSPDITDMVWAINNSFNPELSPGFLIAPELFAESGKSARLSIANALENLASQNKFQWLALADCGDPAEINNVNRAIVEGKTYVSAQGHLAYYYPWGVDNSDRDVQLSAAIAGMAIKRFSEEGFAEPPAGAAYPLKGVKSLKYEPTWNDSNTANAENINLIIRHPNQGIVVWGARTRSADPLYRFVNTRIILNIVIGTLARAFDFEIFRSVGGASDILFDIQRKGNAILDTLWRAGLFYGRSPDQAYAFIADSSVQVNSLLEDGIVNAFAWVVPATTLERLIITVSRVAIGELEFAIQSDVPVIEAQQQNENKQTEE